MNKNHKIEDRLKVRENVRVGRNVIRPNPCGSKVPTASVILIINTNVATLSVTRQKHNLGLNVQTHDY